MLTVTTPCVKNFKPSTRTLLVDLVKGTESEILIIEEGEGRAKKVEAYTVTEFAAASTFEGRAFSLLRSDKVETYPVLISRNPRNHECHCAGFCYGKGKPCKHVAALSQLVANGTI